MTKKERLCDEETGSLKERLCDEETGSLKKDCVTRRQEV